MGVNLVSTTSNNITDITGLRTALNMRKDRWQVNPIPVKAWPVAHFESTETWTASGAGSVAVNTTEAYIGYGKQSIKVTTDAGGEAIISCDLPTALNWDYTTYPAHEILCYIDDVTKLKDLTFACSHTLGSWAAHYFDAKDLVPLGSDVYRPSMRTGWNVLRYVKSLFTARGGAVDGDWASIPTVQIKVEAEAGQVVNVYFASWRVVKPMPIIMLDWDDGYSTQTIARDIANKYGLRCNFYVTTAQISSVVGYTTWAELWTSYLQGHDVCNHGDTHPSEATLDGYSEAQCAAIYNAGHLKLLGRGFTRSARFFASPNGQDSANSRAAAAQYHSTFRMVGASNSYGTVYPSYRELTHGLAEHCGGLKHFGVSNSTDWATLQGYLTDRVMAAGRLFIMDLHKIGSLSDGFEITAEYWEAICSWLRTQQDAGNLMVMTISEYFDNGGMLWGHSPMIYREGLSATNANTVARII